MQNAGGKLGAVILAVVVGGAARADWPCHACRGGVAGTTYDGPVCGERVRGPAHEPVGPIDQCDACARFHGCNGYRQMPDMLAPWQLPPGRGFRPPEAFGYRLPPCAECAGWVPRGARPLRW